MFSLRATKAARFLRLSRPNVSSTSLFHRHVNCRPSSLGALYLNGRSFTSTRTNRLDPRSLMKDLDSELFNYTIGRFLTNDARNLQQRRRVFDIPGLFEIIAKAMNCKTEQIVDFRKLGDGVYNRVFLVTLDTNTQLVASIPYPVIAPKTYIVASEVATMDFLRSKGLPIPKIYGYSFRADNEANTEYILMEYVKGTDLSKIWNSLGEDEIASLMKQLAKAESTMMSIPFPAGGCIYYAKDLKEITGKEGIPIGQQQNEPGVALEEARFCMGPDVSINLWFGHREQLDVFRGPYEDAESVVVAGAKKELVYLDQFGTPRLPVHHLRRKCYDYKKQSPLDHAKNLKRYLHLAPFLVPRDPSMNTFCIRHPNLTEGSIRVTFTGSSDAPSGIQIVSVSDWQNASVLPLFMHAGILAWVSNGEDKVPQSMVKPTLPEDFEELPEEEQQYQVELLRPELAHYYYVMNMEVCNERNYKAIVDPLNAFRRKIITYASNPWEGETIELLHMLIEFVHNWPTDKDLPPCPVSFTPEEVQAEQNLYDDLRHADRKEMIVRMVTRCGPLPEAWVSAQHYEEAKAMAQELKQEALEKSEPHEYEKINENWPFDDFDEKVYL